jgi:hypothetical protein
MAGVDLFLAVDVSASMKGAPLACEKQIAGLLLDSLADDGRFNVATFAAGVARRFESWAPADAKSKSQAREFLAEAAAGEPTNLGDGLVAAFRDTSEDRPCFVVLLSDGCSNLGSPAKEMASLAAVAKKRPVRFLAVAMGQNANMGLLGQIAGLVGGVSIRVIDPGNPASAGAAAAAVIASAGPLATEGLRVRHPGIGVTEWLAPVRESALPGTPIEFMGIAANLEKLAFDVSFQPPGTRGELRLTCGIEKIGRSVGDLRRRYGYLRARQLVADPGVHNDVPAAVEALCDAALRYHLVTSYSYPMFLPLSVPVTDGVLGEMRLQKRLADRADLGWQERDAAVRWARQAGLLYLGEGMRTTSSLLDEARVVPPLASTKAELEVAKPGIDAEAKGDDEKDDLLPKTEARTVGGDLAGHLQQVAIEKQRGRFSQAVVKSAAGRMFYRVQDEWVDGALDPKAEIAAVRFASDLYFALFRRSDLCREVFPCGQKLVFMLKAGTALRVGPQGLTTLPPDELKGLLP